MAIDRADREFKYLEIAGAVQCVGSLAPTLRFAIDIWNAYIEVSQYGRFWTEDLARALPYAVAPLSLIAGMGLFARSKLAWTFCRALAVTWPLAPIVDFALLTRSLHGGEFLILMSVPIGLGFAIMVWVLTGLGRPSLVME